MEHTFHIPVLGLAFSIDSPIKVAQFGISSVMSIVDDELVERLRKYYCDFYQLPFQLIDTKDKDYRANRITAYLNMVHDIVALQMEKLRSADLASDANLQKYFNLLPDNSTVKGIYKAYEQESDLDKKTVLEATLRQLINPGNMEVNIMSKVDKINTDRMGRQLDQIYSDASAALRGFAMSKLNGNVVLSAGMNPRLYSYLAELPQFLPNRQGEFIKTVTLKVSDYRSALIQAKFLAKKAIWVSEFRIESGLNCGGHAFATDGFLLGPILAEFKENRHNLLNEQLSIYKQALSTKAYSITQVPKIKITAQGGIGTAAEHQFLIDFYQLDSAGWGSPFLLVPEATTVDKQTLEALASAQKDDFYVSGASPLGVPFNNFRKSTAELNRLQRIQRGRPGAPCTKKYLISNAEYSQEPICTASRVYQYTKLKELELYDSDSTEYQSKLEEITEKTCLCEGLATSAYLKYGILEHKEDDAVAICPGPNTAYFDRTYSLQEMVDHIYGRDNVLANSSRPHMFINELHLYIEHLKKYIQAQASNMDDKKEKYITRFKQELLNGIHYYLTISDDIFKHDNTDQWTFNNQLLEAEASVSIL